MQCRKNGSSIALLLMLPASVIAQTVPPFIGGVPTVFDVQVNVVESGALLDATPVISQDRRYVTINAQPTNTSLLALQQYRTQTAKTIGTGYVGSVDPTGKAAISNENSPSSILQAAKINESVLNHRGVYLLSPLK